MSLQVVDVELDQRFWEVRLDVNLIEVAGRGRRGFEQLSVAHTPIVHRQSHIVGDCQAGRPFSLRVYVERAS